MKVRPSVKPMYDKCGDSSQRARDGDLEDRSTSKGKAEDRRWSVRWRVLQVAICPVAVRSR